MTLTFLVPKAIIIPTSRWTIRDGRWVKIRCYRVIEPDDRVRYLDELSEADTDHMAIGAVELGDAVTQAGF